MFQQEGLNLTSGTYRFRFGNFELRWSEACVLVVIERNGSRSYMQPLPPRIKLSFFPSTLSHVAKLSTRNTLC